jgi:hypothetical protein
MMRTDFNTEEFGNFLGNLKEGLDCGLREPGRQAATPRLVVCSTVCAADQCGNGFAA